jgi:hypothetical protein
MNRFLLRLSIGNDCYSLLLAWLLRSRLTRCKDRIREPGMSKAITILVTDDAPGP